MGSNTKKIRDRLENELLKTVKETTNTEPVGPVSYSDNDSLEIIHKFDYVKKQIKKIRKEAEEITGFGPFKRYTHTLEVLHNKLENKIYAACEKIGDDVQQWHKTGALSDEGLKTYHKCRQNIAEKLDNVIEEISDREPTLLEKILASFTNTIELIMASLPILVPFIRHPLIELLKPREQKALPKPANKFD